MEAIRFVNGFRRDRVDERLLGGCRCGRLVGHHYIRQSPRGVEVSLKIGKQVGHFPHEARLDLGFDLEVAGNVV
jgi:hypothetical protein